jgi:hypothetical protein
MSNLPERIWVTADDGERCTPYYAEKYGTAVEYLRADLAPAVGYSRGHMREAPDPRALQTFEEWFEWLTKKNGQSYEKTDPIYQWAELAWNWRLKLTPAAQPRPLVEALERIANVSPMGDHMNGEACVRVAREALAAYRGER